MQLFEPHDRDAMLEWLVAALEADPQLDAAVITGSIGSEGADRWSDIDVACVVAASNDASEIAERWVELIHRDQPVAHHYATDFGSTLVRGFLLNNGLEIDLSFTPVDDFAVWAPVRVAFDRSGTATRAASSIEVWTPTPNWAAEAGFAWHDVVHACVAINRRRPWQALLYLTRVRNRTLSLAQERHGWDADEFAHADDLPALERDRLRAALPADLEPGSLVAAIEVATQEFLRELANGDAPLAKRLEQPMLAHVLAAKEATLQ